MGHDEDWSYVERVRVTMVSLDYRPVHRIVEQLGALSQVLKYAGLITGPLSGFERYSPNDAAAAIWDAKTPQHRVESLTEGSPVVVDIALWHVTAVGFVTVLRRLLLAAPTSVRAAAPVAGNDVRRDRIEYLREQLRGLVPGLMRHPVTFEALDRLIAQTVDAVEQIHRVEELPGRYGEVQGGHGSDQPDE